MTEWIGVGPRKLSQNVNFTKPTNRDGARLIMMKNVTQPTSPFKASISALFSPNLSQKQVVVPEAKRPKKPVSTSLGPGLYSPKYDMIEVKRDKSVQNWGNCQGYTVPA